MRFNNKKSLNKELYKAFEIYGGLGLFADNMGVSKQTVSAWYHRRYEISLKNAIKIEKMTNGEVKALNILPDMKRMLKQVDLSPLA